MNYWFVQGLDVLNGNWTVGACGVIFNSADIGISKDQRRFKFDRKLGQNVVMSMSVKSCQISL